MSEKWLNHNDWVVEQFQEKYLKKTYRNSIIHSSIIEGILINESGKNSFDSANRFLLCSIKIKPSEFCIFNEIRKIRNEIVHKIFERGLSQKDIYKLLDGLMNKIHEAYKVSDFLDKKLFKKYEITRSSSITFNPAH